MEDLFTFTEIAGQQATLGINSRDSHCVITWGDLTISDKSGYIGFWTSFHKKTLGNLKGAALQAALKKHAKEMIEAEIYEHVKFILEDYADEY